MSTLGPVLHLLGVPSLATTLGSIYLGVTIGLMLYGLTVHQAYRYYKHYPEDGLLYPKGIVTLVLVFETLHTVVWMYIGYRYLVSEAFNITGELSNHWTVSCTFLVTSFSVYACQTFYCCRIWNFGASYYRWFLIPAIVSMCTGLSFAIVAGVKAFLIVERIIDLDKISWMVSVAYGFSVSSDIILAGILIFTLLRIRRESKVPSTRTVLNTLIIYTINTGLLTSIVSFFAFLFAIVLRGNFIYAGVSIVGAKLYANSVLALLNSRRYLNNRLQDDFSSVSMGNSETSSTSQPSACPPRPPPSRRQARDETSTIVWAVRQQSTVMSSVSTQMNFAAPSGLEGEPDTQV
ncbi:hypothetical protein C8Q73DRAFT_796234 [Cubamyces lactineus]|nr:hypothetical protein C8Q73DRAFT_796234 [Cubamyces lactineus]